MRQTGYATAAVGEATVDCGAALSPHSYLYIVHFSKYFYFFSYLSDLAVCVRKFIFHCFQIDTIWMLRNVSR